MTCYNACTYMNVYNAINVFKAFKVISQKLISNIICYYTNTMKGMKSIEFRIWASSFKNEKRGQDRFEYLTKVRNQMRKIRSIRLDKNLVAHVLER